MELSLQDPLVNRSVCLHIIRERFTRLYTAIDKLEETNIIDSGGAKCEWRERQEIEQVENFKLQNLEA